MSRPLPPGALQALQQAAGRGAVALIVASAPAPRPPPVPPSPAAAALPPATAAASSLPQRARVIDELLATERAYVTHLLRLVTLFVLPLSGRDPGAVVRAAAAAGASSPRRPASLPVSSGSGSAGSPVRAAFAAQPDALSVGGGGSTLGGYHHLAGGGSSTGRPLSYPPGSGALPASGESPLPALPCSLRLAVPLPTTSAPPALAAGPVAGFLRRPRASSAGGGGAACDDAAAATPRAWAAQGRLLSAGELEGVFGGVDALLPLHVSLLAQLTAAVAGSTL